MQDSTVGDARRIEKVIKRVQRTTKFAEYAEFHSLLTLNEALLQHFMLIFITKETGSMYKIRNNRMFYF